MSMLATLEDLLAPVSISEFLEMFRSKRRLYIQSPNPHRAETLLSWPDINNLLSERVLEENIKIIRDGIRIARGMYTSNEGTRLNVRVFHDLLAQGVSIVVNDIDRSFPQIGQLSVAIEREMGLSTNVNGYLSFSKGGAFKPHWDVMDVLVVQVHGNKEWRIWNAQTQNPVDLADRAKVNTSIAPDQEIRMKPGDVLFIPRGEPHSATVSTGHSVHLTIGLLSQTGLDFLDSLRIIAVEDPILREDLPRHVSAEASNAHESALKQRLHALVDSASMSGFLREGDLCRPPVVHTWVSGELPRMQDILGLSLRRRIPLPDVTPDGEVQRVTIGGEVRQLSPVSVEVIRWLFDHDSTTFDTLRSQLEPRYGGHLIESAIRELLRSGFLFVAQARE